MTLPEISQGEVIMSSNHDRRAKTSARRGPRARRRSDERIHKDVNDRLIDDTNLDASDIEVSVDNGMVTLSGSVDSLWDKRRAEDIVNSVPGVTGVSNKLRASMASQTTPIQNAP
jgi:osmotically-inducible protein OsmY